MNVRNARALGAGAAVGGALVAAAASRHRWREWGSTAHERLMALPGDDLVPAPRSSITRAVGIDAPASAVWPWLVQMGRGRGGMYSYDWLENLLGLDIHSARHIVPEWQHLAVGDRVVLVREGWLGMQGGYSLPVAAVDPGRAIVLRQQPPEHPWDATWTFVIEPDGPGRCRLITRSTSTVRPGAAGLAGRVAAELMDPVTLVMTRRMLLGIKDRAEHSQWDPATIIALGDLAGAPSARPA